MNKPIPHFSLGNDRQGLTCGVSGVALAGTPLLARSRTGFEPRPDRELDLLLTAAYGGRLNASALNRGLAVSAQALNDGDVERAMIGALHLRLPAIDERAAERLAKVDELLAKYNYNPEEPRDWRGRWTTDGGGTPPPEDDAGHLGPGTPPLSHEYSTDAALEPIAYNGVFHDQLVNQYADYLRSKGEIVLTEVSLRMADGSIGARLDILARDPSTGLIYGIEVKTGLDPGFTPGQITVYAHAIMGDSVVATDAKVVAIGLLPDLPLLPIPIYLMWQQNADSKPQYRPLDPEKMTRRYRGKPSLEER